MSTVIAPPGGVVVLELAFVDGFASRCPEIYSAVVEASAFVNWRRRDLGNDAVIALSFHKSP